MGNFPEYKREFLYTSSISADTVCMLLGAPIGNDGKEPTYIIGVAFAEEMYFWKRQGYNILVKINCPGGIIMDGFSIMDAVRETGAKTQCVGIAASMAMPILLSGKHRSAYDYAKGMIHPPKGSNKTAVDMMRDSLSMILTKLSDYSKNQIDEMLKDGAPDTWLTAKEMKKRGLVDEVIETEMQPVVNETEGNPYSMYQVYNTLITQEMATVVDKTPASADPAANQAYIDALSNTLTLKDKVKDQEDEITALKAKISAYENAEKTAKETAAKLKVENAIKEKKLSDKPELKDQFVKMALEAPEAFDALITTATAATRPSVVNHMKKNEDVPTEETYEYLANNDPKRLYDLMDNEPEKYQKLVNKWQEKQKAA